MNVKKYLAVLLCLGLLLCGCAPAYEDEVPYTGTFAPSANAGKTDEQWNELLSYAEYLALPAAERSAFADSFEKAEDFSAWLKAVKKIYDAQQEDSKIGNDGVIDMGDIDP